MHVTPSQLFQHVTCESIDGVNLTERSPVKVRQYLIYNQSKYIQLSNE